MKSNKELPVLELAKVELEVDGSVACKLLCASRSAVERFAAAVPCAVASLA